MPKLLQINITANWGSHGRIAEQIGQLALSEGWESYIAYGRRANPSKSHIIHIGSDWDERFHGLQTRLFDRHGLASVKATKQLIKKIMLIKPDIIHLHNIHGYFLNYPILFNFLKDYNRPVVWTLHDCWSFTGHCGFFFGNGCFKWRDGCYDCQFKHVYPSSFIDGSTRNYRLKKKYFTSLPNLTLVPVSEWLGDFLKQSFLNDQVIKVIHNGVDIDAFKPVNVERNQNRIELLGVASNWRMRKGLPDFIELRKMLPERYNITLIGLTKSEIKVLPDGINGLERTNNIEELVEYYNKADIFINPTYEDNFPTVNLEALACGTPVVTYDKTSGGPEAINENTGIVVRNGNIKELYDAIVSFHDYTSISRIACRERAVEMFSNANCFKNYIKLYENLLDNEVKHSNSNI